MQSKWRKQKALATIALLGAMFGATGSSQAGTWTIGLGYNGTSTGQNGTQPWSFNVAEGDTSQGAGWGNLQPAVTKSAKVEGHYSIELRWTPSSTNDVLPAVVGVKIKQWATGTGYYKNANRIAPNEPSLQGDSGSISLSTSVKSLEGLNYSGTPAPIPSINNNFNDGYLNNFNSISQNVPTILIIGTTQAQKQVNGTYLLKFDLPQITAKADLTNGSYSYFDEDGSHTLGDQTNASVGVGIDYALDNHSLYISSNIETSYYKSLVAPTPQPTPPVAAGTPAPTAIPTPTPLAGTSPPIWKLPVQRLPDGSMNVHSVAQWVPHPDWAWLAQLNADKSVANQNWFGGQGFWFGPSTLTANHTGFGSYPFLTWSWSGGQWQTLTYQTRPDGFGGHVSGEPRYPLFSNYNSPLTFSNSSYLNMPLRSGSFANVLDYQVEGLKLGDEDAVLPATTFTVDAQENQNGAAIGPKLTSNYSISWHRPEENWQLKTQNAGQPDVLFDSVNFDVGTTLTRRYPKGEMEIQHPAITGKLSTALGAGAATVALAYPPAAVVANILYFTSATLGIKAQFIDSADLAAQNESQDVEISATYDTLGREIRASRGVAGATFPDAAPVFTGVPPQEWSYVLAAFDGPANQNPYWNAGANALGSWTVHAHVERNVVEQTWLGDAYNANGYQGETTAYITKKGPPLIYREWTWTPAPTP